MNTVATGRDHKFDRNAGCMSQCDQYDVSFGGDFLQRKFQSMSTSIRFHKQKKTLAVVTELFSTKQETLIDHIELHCVHTSWSLVKH